MGGFSKAYAMTGWRVGYVAAPAAILEGMVKVHQYGIMSAPTTAQDAALAAIIDGEAGRRADGRRVRPPPPARWSTASTRSVSRRSSRAARSTRFPRIALDGTDRTRLHRAPADRRSAWRSCPGAPSGRRRGPRPDVLRDVVRAARGGAGPDQPVRGTGPRRGGSAGATSDDDDRRPRALRGRHRDRGPLPAADGLEDVLRLLDRLRRRAAEHATSARSASASRARCRSINRRAVELRPRDRRRDRGRRPGGDPLGPQELLLPGPAQGLPDQPVRPAAGVARPADRSTPRTARSRSTITRAHLEEDTAKLVHADRRRRPHGSAWSTSTGPARR